MSGELPPETVNRLSDLYLTSWDLHHAIERLNVLLASSVPTGDEHRVLANARATLRAIKDRVDEERRALRSGS